MDEERVLWAGHPSHKKDLGFHLVCLLLSPLIVPIVMSLIRFLETRTNQFEVTSERVRVTSGILSRHMEELELYRVKDTGLYEPFMLRVFFKLGHVVLRTSDATHRIFVIPAVPDAHGLREQIRGCVEKLRERKGVRELDFAR
jgi:membrane protein YdbS with pleckstrin-like domain